MPVALGEYTLLERLASGGMGEVWRAHKAGSTQELVIKRVHPHLAANAAVRDAFLNEARLSSLLVHPNIVRVTHLGSDAGQLFVVMERVDGGTMPETIAARGLPSPGVAAKVICALAEALHYAHTARDGQGRLLRVIHCDVAPQNVLISRSGDVKLIDFGIAQVRSAAGGALERAGRVAYQAPEVLDGAAASELSDQFALGVVAWELLTGRPLFERSSDAATISAVLAGVVSELPARVESVLRATVLRMLRKEPAARWPSCAAVADALGPFAATQSELAAWAGAPAQAATALASSVPAWASTYVPRPSEERRLEAALSSPGVVTIVGPGGCGKSRLAFEVVRRAKRSACVVEGEQSPQPAAQLVLVEGVTTATRARALHAMAPSATLVCTSTAPLGLPGERVVELGPMLEWQALLTSRGGRLSHRPATALPLVIELVSANPSLEASAGTFLDAGPVIDAAIEALTASARTLLQFVASLGVSATVETLEADFRAAPGGVDTLDLLEELRAAGVLISWEDATTRSLRFSVTSAVRARLGA